MSGIFSRWYWVFATLAEAEIGLEKEAMGQQRLAEAFAAAPEEWMKETTQEQTTKLKDLRKKFVADPTVSAETKYAIEEGAGYRKRSRPESDASGSL